MLLESGLRAERARKQICARSAPAKSDWGDPSLKSTALQPQILKSLKSMPWHTFKAPETNRVKSVKSGRFS